MKRILFSLALFLALPVLIIYGQSNINQKNIIINECSQGNGAGTDEWVELLVTQSNTDIQGVYIDVDRGTNSLGDTVQIQLSTTYSGFASVAQGAIIVIYNSAAKDPNLGPDDIDFSDNTLLIPDTNTTFLQAGSHWELSLRSGDAIGLFNPKVGTTIEGIMAIAWGDFGNFPTSNFSQGWGYAITPTGLTLSQGLYYNGGTAQDVSNPMDWVIESDTNSTPEAPNPSSTNNGQNKKNIIINELSQGSGYYNPNNLDEWVELLVTADGTDIRGVYLDADNNTNTLGDSVALQLSTSYSGFSSVSKGAIIVIYNAAYKDTVLGPDDTNFSDGTLLIPDTNSTFLQPNPGWKTSKAPGDAIGLFNPKSGTTIEGIMAVAWGGFANFPMNRFSNGWGYTLIPSSLSTTQGFYFSGGTTAGVTNASNWITEADASSTPGKTNGGDNNLLPVELTSFNASYQNSVVELNWRTETEVMNYGFDIQRAEIYSKSNLSNPSYEKIGFVNGHGNSNSPNDYSFIDKNISSGKYLYRLKQIDINGKFKYSKSIEVNTGNIPNKFILEQNYPNPFNPSTTIKFGFQNNTHANLTVYNAIGQQVAELFNGIADAGRIYNINFDGSKLSSGVYFYRLQGDTKTEIKKMLLLK